MRKLILTFCLVALTAIAGDILVVGSKIVTAPGPTPANVVPAEAFGYNEWSNFGGKISDTTNGSGMNGIKYPVEPTTWYTNAVSEWYSTAPSTDYHDEWQAEGYELLTGNAWYILDLGESVVLNEWYLWNGRDAGGSRGFQTFNIYYANTPTVAPAHGPTSSGAVLEYSFASGGWTLLNTDGVLFCPQANGSDTTPQLIVDLGGKRARYIAIEMLTSHGATTRIGFAEGGITQQTYTKGVVQ